MLPLTRRECREFPDTMHPGVLLEALHQGVVVDERLEAEVTELRRLRCGIAS